MLVIEILLYSYFLVKVILSLSWAPFQFPGIHPPSLPQRHTYSKLDAKFVVLVCQSASWAVIGVCNLSTQEA